MERLGTASRPLRVAVVGAGPAGFYVVQHLFQRDGLSVQVDMYDRLPTPFGLVRQGVAPDHQKIKFVTSVYHKLALNPAYRFFGNVEFGSRIFLADLKERYHQVVFTVGAESDQCLHIPGENLEGSYPARLFVAWYNSHPDFSHLQFDLSHPRAVIIGMGNVAADVARILCLPIEELARTDIANYSLDALRESRIKEVCVIGRRGPAQAAFTIPEIRKLGDIADTETTTLPEEMELDAAGPAAAHDGNEAVRKVEIFREFSTRKQPERPKKLVIRFLLSPVEFLADERGHVRALRLVRNELYVGEDGAVQCRATDKPEVLEAGLVLRSVGYRGVPLPDLPFDQRHGVIPNEKGRVAGAGPQESLPGIYVSGWIKRGSTGIIGTNKLDAKETVACMMEDLQKGVVLDPQQPDRESMDRLLQDRRASDVISYPAWTRIDAREVARGEPQGRPRVKFADRDEFSTAAQEG